MKNIYKMDDVLTIIEDAIKYKVLLEGANGGVVVFNTYPGDVEGRWVEISKQEAAFDLIKQNQVEYLKSKVDLAPKVNVIFDRYCNEFLNEYFTDQVSFIGRTWNNDKLTVKFLNVAGEEIVHNVYIDNADVLNIEDPVTGQSIFEKAYESKEKLEDKISKLSNKCDEQHSCANIKKEYIMR